MLVHSSMLHPLGVAAAQPLAGPAVLLQEVQAAQHAQAQAHLPLAAIVGNQTVKLEAGMRSAVQQLGDC